jgi:cellulose synthase/poly-beta-1,6-N-acetylglucosamine synthase-like glycosyltransferase
MNEIVTMLQLLLAFFFGLPFVIFALYGSIILYYNKLKRSEPQKNPKSKANSTRYEPSVSIVIATHNEASVISKKIENLLALDYPKDKLEIIFADDSDDSTPGVIAEYSKEFSCVSLLRFPERMGYSPSMIAGCKKAKNEITVLGDAGSFLDAQAIRHFVSHFQNPEVGAVTGQDVILNLNEEVGKSENLYQRIFNFLRTAESKMDSTFFIKGEATAARSILIRDLANCSATFDTAVGLFLRQKGFKTIYDPQVKFYEYAPLTHAERVHQKKIRAANLIRVMMQFKHLMFKRKYGKFGLIILPMYFGMIVVAPTAILIGFLLLIPTTFFNPTFAALIWGPIGLFVLLSLVFSKQLITTFLDFEYSLVKALHDILIGRKKFDKIDKVASTRRSAYVIS